MKAKTDQKKELTKMTTEVFHFRDSEKVLRDKKMEKALEETIEYVESILYGSTAHGELLKQALKDMGWRDEGVNLTFIDNRRFRYKGFKERIAVEGSFDFYEYFLQGIFRLQIGFDKGKIEGGVLFLRKPKNLYNGEILPIIVKSDVDALFPTISLPVTIALFELT